MTDLTHEQAKALADRWMGTSPFVYEPGMLAWREGRCGIIAEVRDDALWLHGEGLYGLFDPDECWPDLRHAGTRGLALEQMRAAASRAGVKFTTVGHRDDGAALVRLASDEMWVDLPHAGEVCVAEAIIMAIEWSER